MATGEVCLVSEYVGKADMSNDGAAKRGVALRHMCFRFFYPIYYYINSLILLMVKQNGSSSIRALHCNLQGPSDTGGEALLRCAFSSTVLQRNRLESLGIAWNIPRFRRSASITRNRAKS